MRLIINCIVDIIYINRVVVDSERACYQSIQRRSRCGIIFITHLDIVRSIRLNAPVNTPVKIPY